MRHPVSAAVVFGLVLALGAALPVAANVCAFDPVPAATLLFPFVVFDYNDPIDTPQARNPVGPIADCAGDCNNSGQVTVNELLTMVDIALGNLQLQACAAGDQNADGTVTIDEILTAVNYALSGCPAASASVQAQYVERAPSRAVRVTPTPTATATPTPTATPAESAPLM